MPDRTLIRGDSYATRRPLYRTQFLDENGQPMNLTGCTIRTTYKPEALPPDVDPNDESAAITHTLVINSSGVPTMQDGLFLIGPVANGLVEERFSSAETRALPLGTKLYSDIELTDATPEEPEVVTWIMQEAIVTIDAYTNRTA